MDKKSQPILLLATSQDWGGVQVFLFDLAKEMKGRDLPVIVCAGKPEGELGARCHEAGIEFIGLEHMMRDINPVSNLLALFELVKLFKRLNPQVVHLNSSMMGAVGSLAATVAGVKNTVYCIGGWVFNEDIPSWKKNLYIWTEKISARFKDTIIVVHPGDEELAKKLKIKPKKELITIPNGIRANIFLNNLLTREEVRDELGIDKTATIIGTVANAYPPKNLFWYLEVCKKIHDRDRQIFFVIIGEGPQFAELKQKRDALGAQDYVLLTGRRMDAPKLYNAFDVFVLPSSKEGMSLTLLEAMAAGLACVATDVGANEWMLKDGAGIIVPVNDSEEMSNQILKLCKDENLRQEIGAKAKESVNKRFPLQDTLQRHIDVLIR
ncbi:glycosyltransferase [Patescibacteria group bacterium]|nr:glycosyltransferase [Patescibacteria group bacterium]